MIHLKRGPEPVYLRSEKLVRAKAILREQFENSERQQRFHFDISLLMPIKEDLMVMCNNKCAYCESFLGLSGFGDLENFRPKGGAKGFDNEYAHLHYWWLAYEWTNLLVSCQICNQKYKRDWFPIEEKFERARLGAIGDELLTERHLLIDPSNDQPEEHLVFSGNGVVRELTKKGKVTIDIVGLNREELIQKRKEVARNLKTKLALLLYTYRSENRVDRDSFGYICQLLSDSCHYEYVATQRCVLKEWLTLNKGFWEEISSIEDKFSKIGSVHIPVDEMPNFSEAAEIKKVEEKLSHIKRFSIKSIEIKNFKSISHLTLNVLPVNEKDSRESWLLLLGDNGIGKSSILQALALTLIDKEQLLKLDIKPHEVLSRGEAEGYVRILSFEHNDAVELRFTSTSFSSSLKESPTFILGYGSTRLLPQGKMQPSHWDGLANVQNLFDYSTSLKDLKDWLSKVSTDEFNTRIAPAFFDLLALKEGDKVLLRNKRLFIHQHGEECSIDEISDGYKSIIALASDIMQTLSVDNSSYHSTQGIVLIDELGNHLHPRWRMKIVDALRKCFPKLQFIVTTHEPLCLRGLCHGEVNVLVRDAEHEVRVLDKDLLPDHNLLKIDQLLTSDLFGLINTLDPETEKSYEEYYSLLSKNEVDRTDEEKERIREYSDKLASKEGLGTNPQVQVFFEVINEKFAQNIRENGFKTQEELKQETIVEVKNMIDTKQLDWL